MKALALLALAIGVSTAHADDKKPAFNQRPKHELNGKTTITWYGHAAFKIETPNGKTLLVDPWLTNPSNPTGKDDVKSVKADLILVSHGHFDHIGDAADIAKRTKAKLVATFDLGNAIVGTMGYPKDQFGFETGGNFGGTVTVLDGEVTIAFVPAVHSSAIGADPTKAGYGGNPGGFLIMIKDGPNIYHTGDTDLFGDMALIPKFGFGGVDLMLACIGDHFTMGPSRAADAVRLVKAKQVVPMHFGTFPVLTGTVDDFTKRVGSDAKVTAMKIGSSIKL